MRIRNIRPLWVWVLLFCSAPPAAAATGWESVGNLSFTRPLSNGVEVRAGRAAVRVVALSPEIIRVRYARDGVFPPDSSFAVIPSTGLAAAVVQFHDAADAVQFGTSAITVRILRSPMRVVFLNLAGQIVVEDCPKRPPAWNGDEFRVWKSMPMEEHYFGLGDKAGPLDHRGQAFTLWNTDAFAWQESTDPLYKSIPFFLAMRGGSAYGILLDNTHRSSFDFGKESRDIYSFGAEGGELNYYFLYGPHPKKVIEEYTALTGRTPLPPLFALGYQQSRWSYASEAHVREVAHEFRRRKIPADVLYLDIDYQDGNRPFTIDRKNFPNFESMIRDLRQQGYKVVAITDPHLKTEKGYAPYDQGVAGDHFVKNPDGTVFVGKMWPGDSAFPDFTRADTRTWWGTLYRDFAQMGIRGFWNDMNEPAIFEAPGKTMPLDIVHRVDGRTAAHREIHNVYGMQNARATYEGLIRLHPDERPFVLTRAAFAGTQRYAATWTGDNSSTWNHLRLTVPTLLNLGISGYAFVGADVGGFIGSPTPELLTRWIELAAFQPLYRNHTTKGSADQEPWVHGPEHEATRRRYIETRYALLPYIYTAMEETSRTGVPLMLPLFLEFPQESSLLSVDTEYMFGHDLLVAPKVVETLDAYDVVLPRGVWYDYWTGERVQGGRNISVNPPLDTLPVYARGGAIIPQQPVVQNTDEVPRGPLEIQVYPGPDCRGSIYADDGNTFAYQRGGFRRVEMTCEVTRRSVKVKIVPAQGSYRPWWTTLRFVIFGIESAPADVRVDGRLGPQWHFDVTKRVVTLAVPYVDQGTDLVLDLHKRQ